MKIDKTNFKIMVNQKVMDFVNWHGTNQKEVLNYINQVFKNKTWIIENKNKLLNKFKKYVCNIFKNLQKTYCFEIDKINHFEMSKSGDILNVKAVFNFNIGEILAIFDWDNSFKVENVFSKFIFVKHWEFDSKENKKLIANIKQIFLNNEEYSF